MRRGSVTIFISLVLVAVLVVMTALLESARVYAMKFQITEAGTATMDSLFSEFDADLFDRYGLLFYNGAFGNGLIQEERILKDAEMYFRENMTPGLPGNSFLSPRTGSAALQSFIAATDYRGEIFQRSVLDFYKFDLASKVLQETKSKISSILEGEQLFRDASADLDQLENYEFPQNEETVFFSTMKPDISVCIEKNVLQGVYQKTVEVDTPSSVPQGSKEQLDDAISESPVGGYESVKDGGFLNLVIPEGKTLSGIQVDITDLPSRLSRDERTLSSESGLKDETEKIIFVEYLLDYFNSFTKKHQETSAAYEVEYILFGQNSDAENLKKAVNSILLIRTGLNMVTIHRSASKMAAAEGLATAAVGWTGIAPLVPLAREAMILAWAYAESILDMRALLDGGPVPLLKDDTTWILGADGIMRLFQGEVGTSRKYDSGFTYEDYLRVMLYMEDSADLSYGAMDMIQNNMRMKYPHYFIQSEIYGMEIQFTTTWSPIFMGASVLKKNKKGTFTRTDSFSELY